MKPTLKMLPPTLLMSLIRSRAGLALLLWSLTSLAGRGLPAQPAGNTSTQAGIALQQLEQEIKVKDSLYRIQKLDELRQLENKYKTEVQSNQIATLKEQEKITAMRSQTLVGLIVAGALALALAVVVWRLLVIRASRKRQEVEQRLNRARMNPHFFFNVLTSLQSLSLDEKRNAEVPAYLAKYARIMRQSLESTYSDLIPVEEEMEFLRQYLDLQKLRFPGKFNYAISLGTAVDPWEMYLPSMLLHPFIETILEQGFQDVKWRGEVGIHVDIRGGQYEITVTDAVAEGNEGLTPAFAGQSTQIVRERLALMNQKYKSRSDFEITPSPEGRGYKITINLPVFDGNQ